ncbi:hypothetical protein EVAR_32647_1 [Eumeta japonica]|uniref:Uncharacterized protein n=1 Tax=Eumeta variegata TaxID=151549 RepID=A0A4C1WTU8_EUMVA|nr:hypothetical protein EVAR_32647_1 [Eumeta japonica]
MQVRDGGLMLPHARASSCRGYDSDGPVVMALFQGSRLSRIPEPAGDQEELLVGTVSSSTVTPSLGVMVKWWVAAPSGPEKLDDGKSRTVRKNYDDHSLDS